MKFTIKATPQFFILVFITIFIFFAATNIQAGWLYIIDSLLISLLLFSIFSPISQTKKISLSRSFESIVDEFELVEVNVSVKNNHKKNISFFEIIDLYSERLNGENEILKSKESFKFFMNVLHNSSQSFKYSIKPKLRGIYQFNKFIVTSYGPFGLFKFSRLLEGNINDLIVLPDIPIINNLPLEGFRNKGNRYSQKTKSSFDASIPTNIRDYRRGDSRKLVHWKSTARQNKLMVKELEAEEYFSVQIIIDTQLGRNFGEGKENNFEYLVKLAGGIFRYCLNKNYNIELIFFSNNKLVVLNKLIPWKLLLEKLAELDCKESNSIDDIISNNDLLDINSLILPLYQNPNLESITLLKDIVSRGYSVRPVFPNVSSFDSKQAKLDYSDKELKHYSFDKGNNLVDIFN